MMNARFVVLALLGLGAPDLQAGVITIQIQLSASPSPAGWQAEALVSNAGDEAAHQIQVSASLGGSSGSSKIMPDPLLPGQKIAFKIPLKIKLHKPGQYPLITRVDYADANAYRFSAIAVHPVTHRSASMAGVTALAESAEIWDKGVLRARVKNLENETRSVSATLILSKDLSCDTPEQTISLAPRSESALSFPIRRFSALPNSSYPAYILLEYDDAVAHYYVPVISRVLIPAKAKSSAPAWAVAAALLALSLAWTAYARFKK